MYGTRPCSGYGSIGNLPVLVLKPFPQDELGLLVLKPGTRLLNQFIKKLGGKRVLVMPLPDSLATVGSGSLGEFAVLQTNDNPLVDNLHLQEFFAKPEVQKILGNDFRTWVERIQHCQAEDGDYCDKNLTVRALDKGAVRLCWHHDNMDILPDGLKTLANKNLMLWALERVQGQLMEKQPVNLSSVLWWSVKNGVYEFLPSQLLVDAFQRKEERRWVGNGYKSTGVRYTESVHEELERLAKPVKTLEVDAEPPALFMARPKPTTWHSAAYLKFVRSLPCVVTGSKGTDTDPVVAHHLILHGEGKMGGKAHDMFTIPIKASEHRKLHDDVDGWEQKHGSQLLHVKNTIKKALDLGALS